MSKPTTPTRLAKVYTLNTGYHPPPDNLFVSCVICQEQVGEEGFHLISGEFPDDRNYHGTSVCGVEHLADYVAMMVLEQ